MANLQIKGIKDDLYLEIKKLATAENRSVSRQILFLVKRYLSRKRHLDALKTPAEVLLDLSGSWEDARTAEQISAEIRGARKNSTKLAHHLLAQ
jgi:predicted CopG family antitoxin